jgi:hypothetical protein
MAEPRGPDERVIGWRAALVWLVPVVSVTLASAGAVYAPEQPDMPLAARAVFVVFIASLGFVGTLIVTRRPRNSIGWILWGSGILATAAVAGDDYVSASFESFAGTLPGTIWVAWLIGQAFIPVIGAMMVLVPLLFPDGRLLSRRWRWVVVVVVIGLAAGAVKIGFTPGATEADERVLNPLGIDAVRDLGSALDLINFGSFLITLPFAFAAMILRYRRGTSRERAQLRWYAAAVSVSGAFFMLAVLPVGPQRDIGWLGGILTIPLVPIAIGIAILRYRLYDIDRIISRTVSYAMLTAALAVIFVVGVLGLQSVLAPFTAGNTIAVAASTLAVFVVFQPIRRRIQGAVDRRFDRRRYDAERTVATFAERLRDEVDLERLQGALIAAADETVRPASASVWLRSTYGSR